MQNKKMLNGGITATNGKRTTVVEFPRTKNSLMSKLDEKASETIELKKGTLWLIGIVPVFLMLTFNWGGSIISYVREDQTKTEKLNQVQTEVGEIKKSQEAIDKKLDEIQKAFQEDAVQKAKVAGYQLGAAETQQKQQK